MDNTIVNAVKRARTIMVQGTASHVGKSLITAALCRVFSDMGLRVAPFKSQNMALNSAVTADGAEIGRAQAFQALASRIEPTADMNPILLKPTGDSVSQVIIHGRVHAQMSAREYHAFKPEAAHFVMESFNRLSAVYDVIVIEGAGSPAEINLRKGDIVNMGLAEMTDSPVILVGDIDRGGVFAALLGTIELLSEDEKSRVKGLIINKFRGDIELLRPGIEEMEERIGKPFLGVMPHLPGLILPDEDGVAIEMPSRGETGNGSFGTKVKVAIIRLPRISNFTDFDPLKVMPAVDLHFLDSLPAGVSPLVGYNLVIIPGTKNIISDLDWLKEKGFADAIKSYEASGGMVMGICGGFQMLGISISDPDGVEAGGEGASKSASGLGLLNMETVLTSEKKTFRIRGEALALPAIQGISTETDDNVTNVTSINGYEIHMGDTVSEETPFALITERSGEEVSIKDGAINTDGNVMGTYIHGLFDNDALREAFMLTVAGEAVVSAPATTSYETVVENSIRELTDTLKASVDMERIYAIMGL